MLQLAKGFVYSMVSLKHKWYVMIYILLDWLHLRMFYEIIHQNFQFRKEGTHFLPAGYRS